MDNTETRLMILNDAKQRILAHQFKPGFGYGHLLRYDEQITTSAIDNELTDPIASIKAGEFICEGCIRSAMFISMCFTGLTELSRTWDTFIYDDVGDVTVFPETIDVFENDTFLAEAAYEQSCNFALKAPDIDAMEAEQFGRRFIGRTERALAILDRMIANNGRWNPDANQTT